MRHIKVFIVFFLLIPLPQVEGIEPQSETKVSFLFFDYGGKEITNYTTDIVAEENNKIAVKSSGENNLIVNFNNQFLSINGTTVVEEGEAVLNWTMDKFPLETFGNTGIFEADIERRKYEEFNIKNLQNASEVESVLNASTYIVDVLKPEYPDYDFSAYKGVRDFYYEDGVGVYNRVSVLSFNLIAHNSMLLAFKVVLEDFKIYDKTQVGDGMTHSDKVYERIGIYNLIYNKFTHIFPYPFDIEDGEVVLDTNLNLYLVNDKITVFNIIKDASRTINYREKMDARDKFTSIYQIRAVSDGIALTFQSSVSTPKNYIVTYSGNVKKLTFGKEFSYAPIFLDDYVVYSIGIKQENLVDRLRRKNIEQGGYILALIIVITALIVYTLHKRKKKKYM